jgi:hypothetical protein
MMSVDETLMCSFQILKPAEKKEKYAYGGIGSGRAQTPPRAKVPGAGGPQQPGPAKKIPGEGKMITSGSGAAGGQTAPPGKPGTPPEGAQGQPLQGQSPNQPPTQTGNGQVQEKVSNPNVGQTQQNGPTSTPTVPTSVVGTAAQTPQVTSVDTPPTT